MPARCLLEIYEDPKSDIFPPHAALTFSTMYSSAGPAPTSPLSDQPGIHILYCPGVITLSSTRPASPSTPSQTPETRWAAPTQAYSWRTPWDPLLKDGNHPCHLESPRINTPPLPECSSLGAGKEGPRSAMPTPLQPSGKLHPTPSLYEAPGPGPCTIPPTPSG